jgi:cellulose synthase/poly-beta-1,6-N-acetylglucosamine synthase-like glycosyltransferase
MTIYVFFYLYGLFMFVLFVIYVMSIFIPFIRRRPDRPGKSTLFEWHFFIPCLNEEDVIARSIMQNRECFPRGHLWLIDDDSDDRTLEIMRKFESLDDHVHVVSRTRPDARTGKGPALNAAYEALDEWLPEATERNKVIVCVLDADGELSMNSLDAVSSRKGFINPRVGAVQLAVWMRNRDEKDPRPGEGRFLRAVSRWLLRMQDIEFRTIIGGMQSLREETQTVALGGNGQFTRLSALDAIAKIYGEPWHGALLEDYELGVHVLLAGYRSVSIYDAHVSQEAIPEVKRFIRQRSRWTQGNIQCVKYVPKIFVSKNISTKGLLESCYYLFLPYMEIIGIIFALVLFIVMIAAAVRNPVLVIAQRPVSAWIIVFLSFFFSVALFALWGPVYKIKCEPTLTWRQAILYGFGMWIYSMYMYFCLPIAFWRVITRKNSWLKTKHGG